MAVGDIVGHPLVSIPQPHDVDHPGLAQFTSASIIPCLRFYSFIFRVLILYGVGLIILALPLFRFVRARGADAPAAFRNQTGIANFHPNYKRSYSRSLHWEEFISEIHSSVIKSLAKYY